MITPLTAGRPPATRQAGLTADLIQKDDLEAEVAEGLVGLGHAVNFVTLFHGAATAFGGLDQFVGQTQGHRLFAALLGRFLDPAHGQGQPAHRAHFDWHLVVGTADTAGLHFHHGLDVVDGDAERLDRVFAAGFFLDLLERTVDDALGDRFFAALHDHVHEFGEFDIAVLGIRQDFTFRDFATTWHFFTSIASVGAF